VDITTFKILINSTFSTQDAKMMMDINNYYLGTPLPIYKNMRLPIAILPLDIIEKYDLTRLAVNGWVYMESHKGMYGVKQAGLLANQLLQKRLRLYGYYPARHTPVLWLHNTKPTAFILVVDDFAVKYVTTADAHHLRNALLRHFKITADWNGTVYSGITLDWDYNKRTCDISMLGYIFNVLINSNMTHPKLHITHLPDTSHRSMVQKCSMPPKMKHPPFRTNNALPSKKSLAQFYITRVRLIQQCLYPSMT
jgi:hypothetical protein